MAKERLKIGDVFSVMIDEKNKKYFQYIGNDATQLNSEVIRVFRGIYSIDNRLDLLEVSKSEVDFYAHCILKLGTKLGYWNKVGNIGVNEKVNVLFRSSSDDPRIKISKNWWLWRINEKQIKIGELKGDDQKADIGSIIPPDSLVYRMKTGGYDFIYPGY